ncbi:uncharacterized protein LOC116105594 [Pistacia vera]|uniref:uncharacterized protein LOC116105594 n=1 Tax=Pistacia vera TaxID=55513 RepID=UPI0012632250|nr:uncharacterized protein LOC116105594 [Pistacia vera]
MVEEKEVFMQVHDYHLLIKDLKNEEIILPETFVAGCLIEKLLDSWRDYKNSMKHKRKQMSLEDVIVHIRIEETNRLRDKADKAKELTSKANVVENQVAPPQPKNKKSYRKTGDNKNPPKANLAKGDDVIAVVVVSQVNMIAQKKEWIIDFEAIKHICGDRNSFYEYIPVKDGEECVYLGDSRSTLVGVKVSFEGEKIVMSKNEAFVGKGYCSGELLNSIFFENVFPKKINYEKTLPQNETLESSPQNETLWNSSESSELEIRRSKTVRKAKSFGDDYYVFLTENDPQTYEEAMTSRDASL